jgi:hypothetical protein
MESSNNTFNELPKAPQKIISSPEHEESNEDDKEHYVEKFKYIQKDLKDLFTIEITSEASLSYPWVKDELYAKVIEDFNAGKPFALDYMIHEGLLTKRDLQERGIQSIKPKALEALTLLRGPRFHDAKDIFVTAGILTEEEADNTFPVTLH